MSRLARAELHSFVSAVAVVGGLGLLGLLVFLLSRLKRGISQTFDCHDPVPRCPVSEVALGRPILLFESYSAFQPLSSLSLSQTLR